MGELITSQQLATVRARVLAEYATRPEPDVDPEQMLLWSPFGSRLYGLQREDSDYDRVVLVRGGAGTQTIAGGEDVTVTPLAAFLKAFRGGSHTMMELRFSPFITVNPNLDEMGQGLVSLFFAQQPGQDTYASMCSAMRYTLHLFYKDRKAGETPNPKKRLHALRLMRELNELATTGAFNPYIPPQVATELKTVAVGDDDLFWRTLKELSPFDPFRYDPEGRNDRARGFAYQEFLTDAIAHYDRA